MFNCWGVSIFKVEWVWIDGGKYFSGWNSIEWLTRWDLRVKLLEQSRHACIFSFDFERGGKGGGGANEFLLLVEGS